MASALNYFHKGIQTKIKQDSFYKEVLTKPYKDKVSVNVDLASFFEANLNQKYWWLRSKVFSTLLRFLIKYTPRKNMVTTWRNL